MKRQTGATFIGGSGFAHTADGMVRGRAVVPNNECNGIRNEGSAIVKTNKIAKIALSVIALVVLTAVLLTAALLIRQAHVSRNINDDYTDVLNDTAYQTPISVPGLHFITQEISCGYASIEMLANWQGKNITEQTLLDENKGTVSTAMGTGFLDEMTKQFPEWAITRHVELRNSELLKTMYISLAAGMPVPIEFAAQKNTDVGLEWTLHFAIVTGMDLPGDVIIVQNPYGYEETYTVDEFLMATRYESYENMELFLQFGFAFGMFHRNTIYTIQNR